MRHEHCTLAHADITRYACMLSCARLAVAATTLQRSTSARSMIQQRARLATHISCILVNTRCAHAASTQPT